MKKLLFLITSIVILFALNIFLGSVSIPANEVLNALTGNAVSKASWGYIVMESRLPQTVTALLCGASLAVSGLMLQTSFRNPLAGPSILGITNGASLGVAIVMLATGGVMGAEVMGTEIHVGGMLAVIISAFLGAMVIMAILLALSTIVRNNLMLLIVGIMVGYLSGSLISLMNAFASEENVHSYVMWGMGSFSDVTLEQLPWFAGVTFIGLLVSVLLIKPLNALLLGDQYAQNLGFNVLRIRTLLLMSTGLLTAIATAFCGPVAFLGLATPHIARMIIGTENHKLLLPTTILTGSAIALLCNLLCFLPTFHFSLFFLHDATKALSDNTFHLNGTILPLNAVTPIIGAPVILYVIMKKRGS